MRYGFAADLHLDNFALGKGDYESGLNARARLGLQVLWAAAQGLDYLVIAGDVFHVANPTPQLVAAVMATMVELVELAGVRAIHIIPGNHDMVSTALGDNALAPLALLDKVYVHQTISVVRVGKLNVLMVPYPHTYRDVGELTEAVDVCVAHHGIYHRATPEFLKESGVFWKKILKWCDQHDIGWYFAGDWHPHMGWEGGRVAQIGTLIPATFSDAGVDDKGTLVVLEGQGTDVKYSVVNVPGPRFMEVPGKEFAAPLARQLLAAGHTPFIAYPLSDGALEEDVPGAVFKAVPRNHKTDAEGMTKEEVQEILATSKVEEVLSAYLEKRWPRKASRMLETLLKFMGAT